MALPPEKISELKQIIHSQLSQMDIQRHIRDVMSENIQQELEGQGGAVNEHVIIERLQQRGVIDDIFRQIQFNRKDMGRPATHFDDKDDQIRLPVKQANIDPGRRYLYLAVKGGRAFLDHLEQNEPLPGEKVSEFFVLHVLFRGQRYHSRPVPCACEPKFDEGFLLEVHKEAAGEAGKMADATAMLSIADTVHLVLVRTDAYGQSFLASSHSLEWRPILTSQHSQLSLALELKGTGAENKVPVGVLDVQLELFPRLDRYLEVGTVTAQLDMERARQAEKERLFLVYAKQWWKEYLQIRENHRERLVKIFAQDENGNNRPVCSYVRPLRAGRLLDTPRQAARFVSLMHHEKLQPLGGGDRAEQWTSMHAFFCQNRGDCEDHATLMCSLLLGFGLEAYVCVGTKAKGTPHTWVMTITTDGIVTFWESLNGNRYNHEPINPMAAPMDKKHKLRCPYRTVGCVFSNSSFFANCQASDAVETCRFELHNEALWKAMAPDALHSVCGPSTHWPPAPPLLPPTVDADLVANDLEHQLRALVNEHRRDLGLGTVWDDQLSYILTQSLAAYELERITGLTAGNEEFQDAVRHAVPDRHTFKGFPIQFSHRNARRAFTACLRSPIFEEIVSCRGDQVRLAVRVKVFTYPESSCATWMMLACKYKSVL